MSVDVLGALTVDVERSDGSEHAPIESAVGILRTTTTTLSASYEGKNGPEAPNSGQASGVQRGRKLKRFSVG